MTRKIFLSAITIFPMLLFTVASSRQIYAQQRSQYTQYMFNGLIINPAYAGADGPLSVTLIQRTQWSGLEGAPSTQTLSAHSLFKQKQMGVGLTVVNERIGIHKNLNALASYAFHVNLGPDKYVSMGLQAGVHNRKSDYLSLVGDFPNDPNVANPLIDHTSFDFGAGVSFRSPNFYIGFSAPELIPENVQVTDSLTIRLGKTNYFLFSKYRFSLNEAVDLEPSTLLKYVHGLPLSFDLNINMILHQVLTAGVSYRTNESVDFIFKAQITPQLQFGYAYDHPISVINRISNGSHEMMVSYLFRFVRSGINSPR
jgi:type IX secretion system PorP/SprF family membrane protein